MILHRSKLPELAALTGQSMFEVLPGRIWEQLSQLKSNIWNPGQCFLIGVGLVVIFLGDNFLWVWSLPLPEMMTPV
jgi:hypothetical protein